MPYTSTLSRYSNPRHRAAGLTASQILSIAKKIRTLKKEWGGETRPKQPVKATIRRKVRIDKGKPRGPRKTAGRVRTYTPITSKTYGATGSSQVRMKRKMINKKFPQKISQIYYLTSESTYLDIDPTSGTIVNPDTLYSTPSVDPSNASIMLFNVSCCANHWVPERASAAQGLGYRTGNQLCPADTGAVGAPGYGELSSQNNSFIYRNNASSTGLVSSVCPFFQNGLAESASSFVPGPTLTAGSNVYTVPNHILDGISINVKVHNPLICPQYITIKVVKYDNGDDSPLKPGSMGETQSESQAHVNTLCNARSWTGRGFKQIWHKTIRMPGLRAGTKLKYYNIKKSLTLNYLRSQYRKTYNANNMATLGLQALPSFGLADDGFFNATYIIVSSTLTTDKYISTCSVEKNASNPESMETGIPQIASYPPVGLATTGFQTIGQGAQFGISGRIGVFSSVKETARTIGGAQLEAFADLQSQINALKSENLLLKSTPEVEECEESSDSEEEIPVKKEKKSKK